MMPELLNPLKHLFEKDITISVLGRNKRKYSFIK